MVIKGYFPGVASYEKYYIFIALDNTFQRVHGFFINSERNPLSERSNFVLRAQIQIYPGSYDFLTNTDPSYIDSFKPYPTDFSNILTALIECPSKISGQLSPEHLQTVDEVIQDNRTLTPEEKSFLTRPIVLPPNLLI